MATTTKTSKSATKGMKGEEWLLHQLTQRKGREERGKEVSENSVQRKVLFLFVASCVLTYSVLLPTLCVFRLLISLGLSLCCCYSL